jgi:Uma2 family endonuclease
METESIVDGLEQVLANRTGSRLNPVQRLILRQVWQGLKYREIAEDSGYTEGHIKDVGSDLWKLLSKVFGAKVTKSNCKAVLKRYLQSAGLYKPGQFVAALGERSFPQTTPDVSPLSWPDWEPPPVELPKPRGQHSILAGDRATDLALEIRHQNLPYVVPKACVIKSGDAKSGDAKSGDNSGYEPDVIVLDAAALVTEPLWESASIVAQATAIKLVIEVVSSQWQDDYELKMAAYEAMGIPEYWIIDYAGLGGSRHIGKPKQPTLTIATLIAGEYEIQIFRGHDRIVSRTFPALNLTAAQVLA